MEIETLLNKYRREDFIIEWEEYMKLPSGNQLYRLSTDTGGHGREYIFTRIDMEAIENCLIKDSAILNN